MNSTSVVLFNDATGNQLDILQELYHKNIFIPGPQLITFIFL